MNVTEWVNEDKKNKYNAIKHLYKRYASCCIELGGSLEAVDDFLVRFGFQTIVKLVSEDIKEGGTHKIERNENTPQFMTIDNFTFIDCKLLSQSEYFLESLKCESMLPLKNHYDIGEEGERLLVILADIIMPSAFGKQEPLPLPIVDMKAFIKILMDKHMYSLNQDHDATTAEISVQFKDEAIGELYKFVTERYDDISDETLRKFRVENNEFLEPYVIRTDDGRLITKVHRGHIDQIGMDCKCVRENKNDCFKLTEATFFGYSGEVKIPISEKMYFTPDEVAFSSAFDNMVRWLDK